MLKKSKNVTMILKTVRFLRKTISIYWYKTIQGIKSIVNDLIKTISANRQDLIGTTSNKDS